MGMDFLYSGQLAFVSFLNILLFETVFLPIVYQHKPGCFMKATAICSLCVKRKL